MWKTLSRRGCCKYEYMCGLYHLLGMNPTSHDSALLQVVIGGINVDFIAKGKAKTLRVRISQLKIAVLIYRWANLHLVVAFSSGRPTQEVCSSHLEALVATLLVRFFTITSHVQLPHPRLTFYRLLFFKTPWVDWGRELFSSPLLELIPAVMPCLNNANTWWVSISTVKSFYWDMQIYLRSLCVSEHEWCGQAKAAEHSYLLLHYGWEWRNDSRTGRHGHPSADHRGICELSWQLEGS